MNVAIRVDASTSIGSGHLMRCLTLAQELTESHAATVSFLCRDLDGNLHSKVQAAGHRLHRLPANSDPSADAAACRAALDKPPDRLVVDHYGLDARWESAMRPHAHRILVIDDLADRPHDCDLLLDQNLVPDAAQRYRNRVPAHCKLLLGPDYCLLAPPYRRQRSSLRRDIQRVLVFFGGGDEPNMTARALCELSELPLSGDVVLGASNPYRDQIRDLCSPLPEWTLHIQTDQMAQLIARADLAVGAGGTHHWERCVLGLPAVVITTADNQLVPTKMLAEQGACIYLGEAGSVPEGELRKTVSTLMQNPDSVHALSRAAYALLPDGHGSRRVAMNMTQEIV